MGSVSAERTGTRSRPARPTQAAAAVSHRRRYALLLGAATVIVVADQLTKWWALEALDGGRRIELFWTLQFNLVFNHGSAFGAGAGYGSIIGLVAIAIVAALVVFSRRVHDTRLLVALGVIGGGAVGNLIDRMLRDGDGFLGGAVVDFIDLQWWPVFNVADMAIVIGGVAVVALGHRLTSPAEGPVDDAADPGDAADPDDGAGRRGRS